MQDRYVADVGDFGKLALLRTIGAGRRLGLIWYRVRNENHNGDGKHAGYLDDPARFRQLDPELFDSLQVIRSNPSRMIEDLHLALPDATFFGVCVPVGGNARREWFQEAAAHVKQCDIVFVDPDNGIASDRVSAGSRQGIKSVLLLEIEKLIAPGRTIVIYHHADRSRSVLEQAVRQAARLRRHGARRVEALVYRRGTARIYFFVNPDEALSERIAAFADRWSAHVEILNCDDQRPCVPAGRSGERAEAN